MIKLENYEVVGWEHAIRGMRNPMNSWAKSDSSFKETVDTDILCDDDVVRKQTVYYDALGLGRNDHNLMMRLAADGPVHAKYRRMITVYVDITAPLYWWKEFDTYKVGTVANSCSTMHKIHEKKFTLDDFSCEHLLYGNISEPEDMLDIKIDVNLDHDAEISYSPLGVLQHIIIPMLNKHRDRYLDSKNKKYWWQMIQLLPSSYNQKRTVMLNYEVLANIFDSRENHKLDEWREFCDWIKLLPYSELITGDLGEKINIEEG